MPDFYTDLLQSFTHIGIALVLGLLIGSERGWYGRQREEGRRSMGVRTFTLLALLGGVVATGVKSLDSVERWLICGMVFLPVAGFLIVAYLMSSRMDKDLGITTEVAAMLTYWLGVLPAFDMALPASATAVIVALILHLKEPMHRYLAALESSEVTGALQFLLISVVLLPLLPNQGFGPWQALNPYQLWWMVVLISGLSLIGYFAMRLAGPGKGIIATSLAGGLVSSTALTLSLARLYREFTHAPIIASGILIACSTMFLRILVVVFALKRELLMPLLAPMLLGAIALIVVALWYWRHSGNHWETKQLPTVKNPFNLIPALQFAGLLTVVMLGSEAIQHWSGAIGLYILSFFTGLTDVDAIVLSLSPKANQTVDSTVVVISIAIAASTNTLVKAAYCWFIAGSKLGKRVAWPALSACALVFISLVFAI